MDSLVEPFVPVEQLSIERVLVRLLQAGTTDFRLPCSGGQGGQLDYPYTLK